MAKKGAAFKSVFDLVNKVDQGAEVISKSIFNTIPEWVSSGNYIVNACMGGSLFSGFPAGRIVTLGGVEGSGKSFMAVSACREAQAQGYTPIYMDSEGAIDSPFVTRLGVDPNNFIIKSVNTISEVSNFVVNVISNLEAMDEKDRYKVILVLDSLGNLTSTKEMTDIESGSDKRDMTKAQEIKAMFRVLTVRLAKLGIPWIITSHTYAEIGAFFPSQILSGGSGVRYNGSINLILSPAKLDGQDRSNDKLSKESNANLTKTGTLVTVTPRKSRFCKPIKVKFQIPFYKKPNPYVGIEEFLTWENSGIVRGRCLNEKEFGKLKEADQKKCYKFEFEGTTLYAEPRDTARSMVIKHLGMHIPILELWTNKVFTDEFLKEIDENVIRPIFELPNQSEIDDLHDVVDTILSLEDEDGDDEY